MTQARKKKQSKTQQTTPKAFEPVDTTPAEAIPTHVDTTEQAAVESLLIPSPEVVADLKPLTYVVAISNFKRNGVLYLKGSILTGEVAELAIKAQCAIMKKA